MELVNILISSAVVGSFTGLGAAFQKINDQGNTIRELKRKYELQDRTNERIAINMAEMKKDISGMQEKFDEIKSDMKEGFGEIKEILNLKFKKKEAGS